MNEWWVRGGISSLKVICGLGEGNVGGAYEFRSVVFVGYDAWSAGKSDAFPRCLNK